MKLTISQASEKYGIKGSDILYLIKSNRVKHSKFREPGEWMVYEDSLAEFLGPPKEILKNEIVATLLLLITLLKNDDYNTPLLAIKFRCSRRTIERWISALRQVVKLEFDHQTKGYRVRKIDPALKEFIMREIETLSPVAKEKK